ncbi:MAG: FkbM family methyltransferase [Anaerolineae bacterium]|nr:FkbM family methyltransferase [Phycisphaerae bacterium]
MPESDAPPGASNAKIAPVTVDAETIDNWSKSPGFSLQMLLCVIRLLPRGRGVVSRWFGRHVMRNMRRSIRMPGGELVAIDPHNLEVYLLNAISADRNVDVVLRAINAILKMTASKKNVFYDIGANAGFVTLAVAKRFGDAVQIVSFEPQPVLAERVAISARLNQFKNIQVYSLLLGDQTGEMDLFVPTLGVGASSVWWDKQSPGVQTIRRPVERLDALVESDQIAPPTLIKIDVEGAERMVLGGAKELLAKHQPVLLFESFGETADELEERRKILELISSSAAYEFYFVESAGKFRPIDQSAGTDSDDILAAPRGWTPPSSF